MEERRTDVPFGFRTRELCQELGMSYCDDVTLFDRTEHAGPENGVHHADLERIPDPDGLDLGHVLLKCRHCGHTERVPVGLADMLRLGGGA